MLVKRSHWGQSLLDSRFKVDFSIGVVLNDEQVVFFSHVQELLAFPH
jgi:hypothetical protein